MSSSHVGESWEDEEMSFVGEKVPVKRPKPKQDLRKLSTYVFLLKSEYGHA